MKYNFDEIIDRRHEKYSYSMKWGQGPFVADMVGVQGKRKIASTCSKSSDVR